MFTLERFFALTSEIVKLQPVKAVEVGFGDYNGNGAPDVRAKILLRDGGELVFGPLDVAPEAVGDLLDGLRGLIR